MTSFISSFPISTARPVLLGRCAPSPRCTPARPVTARALSEQDKEYVEKVRQRLLHGEGAPSRQARRAYEPPDGSGLGSAPDAMALFRAGQYAKAVPEFRAAVAAAGCNTPEGGRLALWLAQALDAAAQRDDAVAVLEALQAHPDGDVANTAAELLFIVTAPRLEVPRNAFLTVPVADFGSAQERDRTRHLAASGLARRSKRQKKIEKYSLEWYAAQPRTSRADRERSQQQVGTEIVVAAVVTSLLAMALSGG